MSCISTECPLFHCCENALPKMNDTGIPYASYGTGDSTGRNNYWCGPNGKYRMFQLIGTEQTVHTANGEPTDHENGVSLFRVYKGSKTFYLLFDSPITLERLIKSSERFVLGHISEKEYETIESNERKMFHLEDFDYGAINIQSFDFIECVTGEIVFLKGFLSEPYMSISQSSSGN